MAENSVIGASTVVSGHVRGQGSLEILGRVEGDVTLTGDVVVGASGRVRGNISASSLTVSGQVQGNLRGSEAVLLESSARVVGDIASPRIGIAPGALVRGHVQTDGELSLAQVPANKRPGTPLRVAPVAQPAPPLPLPLKAPAKAEPRRFDPPRPPVVAAAAANVAAEVEAPRPAKPEPRRPPPPVVPVISKGTKAKKKKGRD